MRVTVLLAMIAVLVASACNTSKSGSSDPTGGGATADASHTSRGALVYAAVIRQLVTNDHGFGSGPSPYRHVYVLDGAVPTAADPMHLVSQPAKPFVVDLAQQMAAELETLPPISFVRSRGLAIAGAEPGHVVHRGVLITLGRIQFVDSRTDRVANNRWASGDNGQWLTYTVKCDGSSWRVVGVSGDKIAIS